MKNIFKILSLALIMVSCGSKQNVITNSGEVYSVKGNSFYQGDTEVTSQLSDSQKQNIKSVLDNRLEAEKERAERIEELEKRMNALKDQLKELEKTKDNIENKEREISRAREDYIKTRLNLLAKENELDKLENGGSLTLEKRKELEAEIMKLKKRADEDKRKLDSLNRL
ncbi:hypothetical protein ACFQ1Q_06545 [Winogradskyella litorisediminis]|uniref:Lipoprotein n=1 Tax=Winogradskyella litorisediminis TaxID=1156618 RepID=A0ABW3N8X6_9FLAO